MDNKKLRGAPDNQRIDFNDPNERRSWCHALRVNELELWLAMTACLSYQAADVRDTIRVSRAHVRKVQKRAPSKRPRLTRRRAGR